jgi:hypothetical protein
MPYRATAVARIAPAAFLAIVVLISGCLAALVAHVAIDFVGDYAVAHDTYDGVAHHSRAVVMVCAIALALVAGLRFLWSACDDAHCANGALQALVRPVLTVRAWRYVATVAVIAVVTLIAMESLDAFLDTGRIGDLADALGGSAPLGLSLTLACAAFFALASLRVLRSIAAAHRTIVDAFCALLLGARALSGSPCSQFAAVLPDDCGAATSVLALRAAKRAPPQLFV